MCPFLRKEEVDALFSVFALKRLFYLTNRLHFSAPGLHHTGNHTYLSLMVRVDFYRHSGLEQLEGFSSLPRAKADVGLPELTGCTAPEWNPPPGLS